MFECGEGKVAEKAILSVALGKASTKWLGLDKYKSVLYGVHYDEHAFLLVFELRKANLFTGKIKTFKEIRKEDPLLTSRQDMTKNGEFIGILNSHQYKGRARGPHDGNIYFVFFLVEIENGVKRYVIDQDTNHIGQCMVKFINIANAGTNEWFLQYNLDEFPVIQRIQFDDENETASLKMIKYVRKADGIDGVSLVFFTTFHHKLAYFCKSCEEHEFVDVMFIYDVANGEDKWSMVKFDYTDDIPLEMRVKKGRQLFTNDENETLYAICSKNGGMLKFDWECKIWFMTKLSVGKNVMGSCDLFCSCLSLANFCLKRWRENISVRLTRFEWKFLI